MATPYGPDTVRYYLEFVGNPAQRIASAEGRSPAFPGGAFFATYIPLALVAYVAVRATLTRRPAPWPLLGACAITGIAAAGRIGNLPWHMIVAALLIAALAKPWLPVRQPRPSALAGMALAAAALGVAVVWGVAVHSRAAYEAATALRASGAAADAAARHPCWTILADNLDAAALEWHDPSLAGRIAYDARAEVYSPTEMMRWAIFESGQSSRWASTIQGYELLVGSVDQQPALVQRLAQLRGGVVIERDASGIAVVNRPAVRQDGTRCA
jgi:hypothetical protein